MKNLISFVCIVVAVMASPRVKREAYKLPDGAELLFGHIEHSFSCDNHIYGYYADVANHCKVFHVCLPRVNHDGKIKTYQFSFFCGNQTVFDQENLVCSHPENALPCDQAPSKFSVNEEFGKKNSAS